jgi:AraC-like DNA-binding protein
MQRNFEPMRKQVEAWQRSEVTDVSAKVIIYEAFVEGKLEAPKHLAHLAQRAGTSRARLAAYFRQVVGMTPFDYLTNWRLGVAQTMLRKGNSLKLIASAVGYANATALTRVFTQRVGMSPSEWLARSQGHRK